MAESRLRVAELEADKDDFLLRYNKEKRALSQRAGTGTGGTAGSSNASVSSLGSGKENNGLVMEVTRKLNTSTSSYSSTRSAQY